MVGLRLHGAVALALFAASSAFADASKLPGMGAYQNGDFGTAARALQQALPKLSGEDRMQALMYLAAAHFAKSRIHDTHESLGQLFKEFPEAKLDPNVFDPDLIALSRRVEGEERARRSKLAPSDKPDPREAPPQATVVEEEEKKGRGPLPYVATGGAAVALGASLFFITSANRQKSELDGSFDGSGQSALTYPEAQALREGANRDMTLALASAAGTAALTGLAIWLWTRNDP